MSEASFVTSDRRASVVDGFRSAFMSEVDRYQPGMLAYLRFHAHPNRDTFSMTLGMASVDVSGLELIQAVDPAVLGAAKAAELIDRYTAALGSGWWRGAAA